jgi:hypothetical protein
MKHRTPARSAANRPGNVPATAINPQRLHLRHAIDRPMARPHVGLSAAGTDMGPEPTDLAVVGGTVVVLLQNGIVSLSSSPSPPRRRRYSQPFAYDKLSAITGR